jgi:ubiquinone/menaquinone biosynthesis C-methylase UbiE
MNKAEFDQFADEYDAQHRANIAITGETPEYFARYKIVELSRLTRESGMTPNRILDFGSGIGSSIPHFRAAFPQADLTCSDVSERSLELARARFPGPEQSTLIDATSIPVSDGTFDVAFSACVFHHIPHEEHVHWLQEIRRVTRPGGLIAIFEHNPANPLTVRAVNTCPFDANAHLIPSHQLLERLSAAGWSNAKVNYHIFFPRILAPLRALEPALRWLPIGAQYAAVARNS